MDSDYPNQFTDADRLFMKRFMPGAEILDECWVEYWYTINDKEWLVHISVSGRGREYSATTVYCGHAKHFFSDNSLSDLVGKYTVHINTYPTKDWLHVGF